MVGEGQEMRELAAVHRLEIYLAMLQIMLFKQALWLEAVRNLRMDRVVGADGLVGGVPESVVGKGWARGERCGAAGAGIGERDAPRTGTVWCRGSALPSAGDGQGKELVKERKSQSPGVSGAFV